MSKSMTLDEIMKVIYIVEPTGRNPKSRKSQKNRLIWLLANGPCKECGSWAQLTVDHIDPEDKSPELRPRPNGSRRTGYGTSKVFSWSKERMEKELAKCQVLCLPCHQLKNQVDCLAERRPR